MFYYGYWSANGHTGNEKPIVSRNKKTLEKDLREICKGNLFVGSLGHIKIWDEDDNLVCDKTIR